LACAANHTPDTGGVDACVAAFCREIGRHGLRIVRMLKCRLQGAQAHLGTIIGAKTFCHEIGQYDLAFAQLFDDAGLHPRSNFNEG
jgi:hypothetical protein